MLELIDLTQELKKGDWKAHRPHYRQRLYDLEKAAFDSGMATMVVFEGWDAAGKGTSIRQMTSRLDPRGFKVHPVREARTYEKAHPWLWRFWNKLPNYGQIAIFDRSWYGRVLVERVEGFATEAQWRRGYTDIVEFERLVAEDGYVLIKFFLHISKEEQRRRFDLLESGPLTAWQVADEDWEHHEQYDMWLQVYEEMLERTDTPFGPWTIVPANNREFMLDIIFRTLVERLEEELSKRDALPPEISIEDAEWEPSHAGKH